MTRASILASVLAVSILMSGLFAVPATASTSAVLGSPASAPAGIGRHAEAAVKAVSDPAPNPVFPPGTTRLAGASRYDTAIEVSQRYAPHVPAVFIATGTNFPDALSAAAAAALLGGPLLLVTPTSIPANTLREVERLAPEQIFVIGGTGAVSAGVAAQLEGIAPVERLAGADRYATGRAIVKTAFPHAQTVFLATGSSFPDALAATGAAGALSAPVLLVRGTAAALDADTVAVLRELAPAEVVIAGGTGVVSSGIAAQLTGLGYSVSRHGGATRYETAALVNSAFFSTGVDTSFLATGTNFPDALAAAALAGRIGAPLYITAATCMPEPVKTSMDAIASPSLVVMGGPAVVSETAAAKTGCLTPGTPVISGKARVTSTLTVTEGAWTAGTAFRYQWYADGRAISGATGSSLWVSAQFAGKRISVLVTGSKAGYLDASRASAPTSAVGYPSSTSPVDSWNCPSWAPIKGNADSMLYHVPTGRYYAATKPEECFRSEAAAKAAGYVKSRR